MPRCYTPFPSTIPSCLLFVMDQASRKGLCPLGRKGHVTVWAEKKERRKEEGRQDSRAFRCLRVSLFPIILRFTLQCCAHMVCPWVFARQAFIAVPPLTEGDTTSRGSFLGRRAIHLQYLTWRGNARARLARAYPAVPCMPHPPPR